MFSITMAKGFTMKFPNGVVASVQWGPGNYCEVDKFSKDGYYAPVVAAKETGRWDSKDAEVAAWKVDEQGTTRGWVTKELYPEEKLNDDVIGHLNVVEVMDFLNRCQNFGIKEI